LWLLIVFALILALIIAASFISSTSQRKKALREELNNPAGFAVSQSFIGEDGNSAVAVDSVNKKICLLKLYGDQVKTAIVSYRDLISAEIFIERGETAGTPVKKLPGIKLRIVINNSSEPVHVVYFFTGECKKDSPAYRHAVQQAEYWKGLLSLYILPADSMSS